MIMYEVLDNTENYPRISVRKGSNRLPLKFVDGVLDLSEVKEGEHVRWYCKRCRNSSVFKVCKALKSGEKKLTEADLEYCDWCKGWIYGKVQGRDF